MSAILATIDEVFTALSSIDPTHYRVVDQQLQRLHKLVHEMLDRDLDEVVRACSVMKSARDCPRRDDFFESVDRVKADLDAAVRQLHEVINRCFVPRRNDIATSINVVELIRNLAVDLDTLNDDIAHTAVDGWHGQAGESYREVRLTQVTALAQLQQHLVIEVKAISYLAHLTAGLFNVCGQSLVAMIEYLSSVNSPSRADQITNGFFDNSYSHFRYMVRATTAIAQLNYLAHWLDDYVQSTSHLAQEWSAGALETATAVDRSADNTPLLPATGLWPDIAKSAVLGRSLSLDAGLASATGVGSASTTGSQGDTSVTAATGGASGADSATVADNVSADPQGYYSVAGHSTDPTDAIDIDRKFRPWD